MAREYYGVSNAGDKSHAPQQYRYIAVFEILLCKILQEKLQVFAKVFCENFLQEETMFGSADVCNGLNFNPSICSVPIDILYTDGCAYISMLALFNA